MRGKENNEMEMSCYHFMTDSIVSNLIRDRKLTANDEYTFLILLIYSSVPGISSAPSVYLLAIIATSLTKGKTVNDT